MSRKKQKNQLSECHLIEIYFLMEFLVIELFKIWKEKLQTHIAKC